MEVVEDMEVEGARQKANRPEWLFWDKPPKSKNKKSS